MIFKEVYGKFIVGVKGIKCRVRNITIMSGALSRRKINMFGIGGRKERERGWAAFEAEALPLMADVFRVANYLTRDRETAEDLTQKIFAEALKSFHRMKIKIEMNMGDKSHYNFYYSDF